MVGKPTNEPLKCSTKPFCFGLPGRIYASSTDFDDDFAAGVLWADLHIANTANLDDDDLRLQFSSLLKDRIYLEGQVFNVNLDTVSNILVRDIAVTPPTAISEPSILALFATGIFGLTALNRRRSIKRRRQV